MKKLPVIMISAAMLATSVAPSFAAASYSSLQSGAQVVQVDDHWRHHGHHDGFRHSGWRDDNRGWRGDHDWHHRHHHGNAGAIIGGLAAGAIIGGALAPDSRDYYYDDY